MAAAPTFEVRAGLKTALHAAKYPHSAVCGLYLGPLGSTDAAVTHVSDAVPVTHVNATLPLTFEVAVQLVSAHADLNKMRVVGAYFFEEAYSAGEPTQYARQLMAALAERFGRVILVTATNSLLLSDPAKACRVTEFSKSSPPQTLSSPSVLDQEGVSRFGQLRKETSALDKLVDVEDTLDRPSLSFLNQHIV